MTKHKKKIHLAWNIIVALVVLSMIAFTILPLLG